MRIAGQNVWAILMAALAMYAVGALIYGVLFSALWMQLSGVTRESFAGQEWRMGLSPVMPLLITAGISVVNGWRGKPGLAAGATTGLLVGALFLFGGRMYDFVYGTEPAGLLALDGAHLVLGAVIAGAILGAWKKA